ncbi:helix-turn-helix domain-containing protein [Devosia sp. Naph2]|uniref:helix-turn-helix domain-containing protein n=1 Tax=Devosia polycyclovorans TaxID=3345148 RepID=UPI0035D0D0E6
MSGELTRAEKKLYAILEDGEFHTANDLAVNGLGKRFTSETLIPTHINRIRKKLGPDFLIERPRQGKGYRLVRNGEGER